MKVFMCQDRETLEMTLRRDRASYVHRKFPLTLSQILTELCRIPSIFAAPFIVFL